MNKKTRISMAVLLALACTAPAWPDTTVVAAGVAEKSRTAEDGGFAAIQAEIDRMSAGLRPGEALGYYVFDPSWNPADRIGFLSKGYSFKAYADFAAKLKELQGPGLPKPGFLPKGFKLTRANVYLATPDPESDAYAKLEEELKEKAANGKEKVVAKRIASDKANGGGLIYEKAVGKEKRTLMVSAVFLPPDSEKSVGGTPAPAKDSKAVKQKVKINRTEAVYTFDPKASYKANLSWTDKKNKVEYQIYGQRSEDKKELIAIARSMLA